MGAGKFAIAKQREPNLLWGIKNPKWFHIVPQVPSLKIADKNGREKAKAMNQLKLRSASNVAFVWLSSVAGKWWACLRCLFRNKDKSEWSKKISTFTCHFWECFYVHPVRKSCFPWKPVRILNCVLNRIHWGRCLFPRGRTCLLCHPILWSLCNRGRKWLKSLVNVEVIVKLSYLDVLNFLGVSFQKSV